MFGAVKDILRNGFRGLVGLITLATLPLCARNKRVAVFYGGARSGDLGGTLVKVRLLQSRFPEHLIGYSLLYMLSNAIYLPASVIKRVRAAGVPLVLNQNGVFYPGWYPDGWQKENARMAAVHAAADHVLYQSEFCRLSAEKFLGRRSGSSEILFNGVDTEFFVPSDKARKAGAFSFLATGKFGRSTAYRLSSSIAGLAAARSGGLDVRLIVAGPIEPAVESDVHTQIASLGLHNFVTLLGPYTGAQAPAIYQAADAYLMTKHNDPCPNAVLEALACGLPVLYSASGGVPEQVGPDAGYGLPVPQTFDEDITPGPGAIADGMVHVIRQRDAMATAARARAVERFDLSLWLDRHEAIFRSLVEKTG